MTEPISPAESPRERVLPVVTKLQTINYDQVKPLLDAKHQADPLAGIAIAHLEVPAVVTPDGEYHFHAARVFTSSPDHPNFVKPHYHTIGEEPYVILSENGGDVRSIGMRREMFQKAKQSLWRKDKCIL